jgi:hypothetical protein
MTPARRFVTVGSMAACAAVFVGVAPHEVRAQAHDPPAAEALFRQAREARARGDYAAACPKFAESQRLDPSVGTLMNLAECEEHEGHLAQAWESWHEALDQLLRTNDERVEIARAHADDLDRRVPRLVVRLAPGAAGARVERDGVVLGAPSLGAALPVDPGEHRLVVRSSGHAPGETVVNLAEGERREVVVGVGPAESGPAGAAPSPLPDAAGASPWRTTGFVALGVAGVTLVTAVVSAVLVAHDKSVVDASCDSARVCSPDGADAASAGKTWLVVNTVSSIVTVAAAGAGVALVLTHPARGPSVRLTPASFNAGASVRAAVTGAF